MPAGRQAGAADAAAIDIVARLHDQRMAARLGALGAVVIGRFAPTPSGRMHIGNVYAMLGAWLSARAGGPERTSRTGGGAGDADCLNNVNRVDGMSGAAIQAMRTAGEGACCCASRTSTPRACCRTRTAGSWTIWHGWDWTGMESRYTSRGGSTSTSRRCARFRALTCETLPRSVAVMALTAPRPLR